MYQRGIESNAQPLFWQFGLEITCQEGSSFDGLKVHKRDSIWNPEWTHERGPGVSRNEMSDEAKPPSVLVNRSRRSSIGEDKSVRDPLDKVPWTDG
jgi:hypothetical protein